MNSVPERRMVERWWCPGIGCRRNYSRASSTLNHMKTCWRVTENSACMSCEHFVRSIWKCALMIPLDTGVANRDCPEWEKMTDG